MGRAMSNQELREQVGLPIEQRSMPATQMMVTDMAAVFEAFIVRNT